MGKRLFFLGCVALVAGFFSPWAAARESGKPLLKTMCPDPLGTEYTQAMNAVCAKAIAGEKMAQYETGLIALKGTRQTPAEPHKAAWWLEKAAGTGNTDAMYLLGTQYAAGNGVEKDLLRSRLWHIRAGVRGHPLSQLALAEIYAEGKGVAADQSEANRWMAKAKASGNWYAGVRKPEKATPGLKDRAVKGDPVAQYDLAMSTMIINLKSYDTMEAWLLQSAGQGYAPAQVQLGVIYTQEMPGRQDIEKAARCFRLAAGEGDARGQYELAVLHLLGRIDDADKAEAIALLRQSVAKGYDKAYSLMGMLYVRGIGVNENREVARAWYRHAALSDVGALQDMLLLTRAGDEKERGR